MECRFCGKKGSKTFDASSQRTYVKLELELILFLFLLLFAMDTHF